LCNSEWLAASLCRCFFPIAVLLLGLVSPAASSVTFDDSADPMVLGSESNFEIGFSKSHGGIAYIRDETTGENISLGNSYSDLWRIQFQASGLLRSSTFSPSSGTRTFSYAWNAADGELVLTYDCNEGGDSFLFTVTIQAPGGNHVDISAALDNDYGDIAKTVYIPSELTFDMNEVEQFFFPYYEGVAFQKSFFQELRSTFQKYQHVFADFGALESTQGNMALYALSSPTFHPATLGLGFTSWAGGSSAYHHMFHTYVVDGQAWSSVMLRLRIGSPIDQTLEDFREDRGWNGSPTLQDKVGDKYDQLSQSFLVKLDIQHVYDWGWAPPGEVFQWVDSVCALLPSTAFLHPVSFWPNGFDNSYPDYIPPNPDYGTSADFLAIFENAHGRDQLVMPYTNPTWWDDESPTLDSLGTGVVVYDLAGNPFYECYGANCGYVVCPSDQRVKDRLAVTVDEFTEDYPADFLFEDQVADRPWTYDTNPAEPSYVSYTDGLLDNTRVSSQEIGLATEGMLDVLLETEMGFFDSVMLDKKAGWVSNWGSGNWVVYPLTMMLAHDKAVFYQHNLAVETMTHNKEMLTYNLSFGFGLNFNLTESSGMMESDWLDICEVFQRDIASKCAGVRMSEFEYLDAGKTVSRSIFGDTEVIGNHGQTVYDYGDYRIAAQGCLASWKSGKILGGVFTRFNGVDLSGEHFLVRRREGLKRFVVEQPSGADCTIRIARPPRWPAEEPIVVEAVLGDGSTVDVTGEPTTQIGSSVIDFLWQRDLPEGMVSNYAVRYDDGSAAAPDPTGVESGEEEGVPKSVTVTSSPNPFNPTTTIRFGVPRRCHASLRVYDASGRVVRLLLEEDLEAGYHEILWDGRGQDGRIAASGVYFARLSAGDRDVTHKLILVR